MPPIFPAPGPNPSTDSVSSETVVPLLVDLAEPGAAWVAGLPFEYLPSCPSTNAVLKRMAETAPSGMAVVTDHQTAGRGRLGRSWISSPGLDLAFSVLLHPALEPARGHLLSIASGVAVAEVLEECLGLTGHVSLKWPNDVLVERKKICGILLEASADAERIRWAVAGIGLNVNSEPERLVAALAPDQAAEWQGRPAPISLKEFLGRDVPRAPLLAALLARLTVRWTALERADEVRRLLGEWRRRDALAGRRVQVHAGAGRREVVAVGEAAGIGDEGQLLVRSADGAVREIFAGDVSVVPAAPADSEGAW